MQMFCRSPSGPSRQPQCIACFHNLATPYQVLRLMTVDTLQPVGMTDHHQIAISSIRLRKTNHSLECTTDGIVSPRLEVDPTMPAPSPIRGNHFGSRQWETIVSDRQSIKTDTEMCTVGKQAWSLDPQMIALHRGKCRSLSPTRYSSHQSPHKSQPYEDSFPIHAVGKWIKSSILPVL